MTVALGHTLGGQDPAYRSSLALFFRSTDLRITQPSPLSEVHNSRNNGSRLGRPCELRDGCRLVLVGHKGVLVTAILFHRPLPSPHASQHPSFTKELVPCLYAMVRDRAGVSPKHRRVISEDE